LSLEISVGMMYPTRDNGNKITGPSFVAAGSYMLFDQTGYYFNYNGPVLRISPKIYENNKFPEMIIPMSIFTSQLRKTKIELASGIFALSFIIAGISI